MEYNNVHKRSFPTPVFENIPENIRQQKMNNNGSNIICWWMRSLFQFQIVNICLILMSSFVPHSASEPLDEYIRDYQPLTFDTGHLHSQHQRAKRSTDGTLHLDFRAYDRDFKLRLKRDRSIFEPDHMTEGDDGRLQPVDTSFIYSGHALGHPKSFAHIAVIDGVARGYVDIPGDTTYHIEPSQQYFGDQALTGTQPFHAVIYPESKMDKDPFRHKREADDLGSCGMDRVKEWMNKMASSSVDTIKEKVREKRSNRDYQHPDRETPKSKYSASANGQRVESMPRVDFDAGSGGDSDSGGTGSNDGGGTQTAGGRRKRATLGQNNTCFLYLRSDPMMWNFIKNEKFKTKLSDERSKEEILAFFASHVSALKNIFHRTTFTTYSGDLSFSGVNFVVQRTSIMTPENRRCGMDDESSYCNPNIDVSNFLNLNSMDQHDEFCLAYIFTHRDFTRGTLGLAWVGAREVASGGICERYKSYLEKEETVPKSLNTGIVTTVNYGKAVPARVSQLTFTHEVGHNFGSPHDQGTQCAPFGSSQANAQDGNFIMFASATMGDRPNNDDFSVCSKDNITRLLQVVVEKRNGKRNCFKPSKTAFCGNGIKEENEQCDCGYSLDCEDSCCYGRDSDDGRQCTLKPGMQCSPTAGPCCSPNCRFVEESSKVTCLPADECRDSALCMGNSAECPLPRFMDNDTSCNDHAQMCYKGECVNSVCGRIGWKECFLTSTQSSDGPSSEALCYVSCTNPTTGYCVSSFDKRAVRLKENAAFFELLLEVTRNRTLKSWLTEADGIQLPAGSPCDNFKGYCDVFHKCRGVDADGPLARLKNLIFNPETLQNIQVWIVSHWWAVLLMAVALIVVMGAFIKVCAVHTPSSNPRKPKHRQLTLPRTLQRRHRQNQGQRSGGGGGGAGGGGGGQQQGQHRSRGAGPRSIDPVTGRCSSSGNSGSGGGGGGGDGRRGGGGRGAGANKPVTSSTVLIEQEPPPPYTSVSINAPASSSPAAPMIEPVGAPDLSNIPPGGPKRGRGGGRMKGPGLESNQGKLDKGKQDKGKKGGGKKGVELKML